MHPQDIYFYADIMKKNHYDGTLGSVMVVMCPIDFFNSKGYVSDSHLNIHSILPPFVRECGECLFESYGSLEETRKALIDRGFVEDERFSEFCRQHDPFV